MKTRFHSRSPWLATLLVGLVGFCAEWVSVRAADAVPARRAAPLPPVTSPEITADHFVTFRIRASKAAEVLVNGQWPGGRAAMTRDTNGVWGVNLGPVPAGVWEYSLVVDGVSMIDPGNPAIKPMREPRTSILHVPAEPPSLLDFQDVPHGLVREHAYRSKTLGRVRPFVVYTPPGYDRSGKRFPVLYLQHGSGDNQATWVAHGKAHWILDNLIAQRRAVPMIVVMLDGHAVVGPGAFQGNTQAFEQELLQEVLPMVESQYRVRRDPASRAVAGLSMGGGQSLGIGLRHTDQFGWVAGFSAAAPERAAVAEALGHAPVTNKRLKLLWIACGREDFLLKRNEDFVAALKEAGVRHEWHLTDGNHSWPVWRGYLADLAPLLFR